MERKKNIFFLFFLSFHQYVADKLLMIGPLQVSCPIIISVRPNLPFSRISAAVLSSAFPIYLPPQLVGFVEMIIKTISHAVTILVDAHEIVFLIISTKPANWGAAANHAPFSTSGPGGLVRLRCSVSSSLLQPPQLPCSAARNLQRCMRSIRTGHSKTRRAIHSCASSTPTIRVALPMFQAWLRFLAALRLAMDPMDALASSLRHGARLNARIGSTAPAAAPRAQVSRGHARSTASRRKLISGATERAARSLL